MPNWMPKVRPRMRKLGADPGSQLMEQCLATRHEHELADPWRDLKGELLA